MSAYPFRCRECDTTLTVLAPIGSDVQRPPCPNPEHGPMARDYSSVATAPSALTTRTGAAAVIEANTREANWSKDLPAYKRLRRQGYQPRSTEGAALMEQMADTRIQLEHGINSPPARAEAAGIITEPA